MLKRIRIQGFRSWTNKEFRLSPFTVMLGDDDCEKSDFLDALALLSRLAGATVQDAVVRDSPPALGNFYYPRRPEELVERGSLQMVIEADIEAGPVDTDREGSPMSFSYLVAITARPNAGEFVVSEEELRISGRGNRDKEIVYHASENHLIVRERGRIGGEWDNRRTILSLPLSSRHFPRIVALQRELRQWRIYPHPDVCAMSRPSPLRYEPFLMPRGENLSSFLHTMSNHPERMDRIQEMFRLLTRGMTVISRLQEDRVEFRVKRGEREIPQSLVSPQVLAALYIASLLFPAAPTRLIGFAWNADIPSDACIALQGIFAQSLKDNGQIILLARKRDAPFFYPLGTFLNLDTIGG